MIENESEMWREPFPRTPIRRTPTFDGSIWGPDACRCSDHVDPHEHIGTDPYTVKSVFADELTEVE